MTSRKTRSMKTASLRHERTYFQRGHRYIIGIDEAGRGPWAGPVAAGAVCLPLERDDLSKVLRGVRDSKQMTVKQRQTLVETIKEIALVWGVGHATAAEIDEIGIVPATMLAMQRALEVALHEEPFEPSCLFIDDMLLPELLHYPQISLIEGDSRSLSIAAASVLAKTWRDDHLLEMDAEFPQYGFAQHKGYGTPAHRAALKQYGPSPVHRQSYRPIRELSSADDDA